MTETKNKTTKTHAMSGDELKRIRVAIGYAPRDLCAALGLKRRTHQDYEAGKRAIPESVAEKARQLLAHDRKFMATLGKRLAKQLDRDFPAGIPSAVDRSFNED